MEDAYDEEHWTDGGYCRPYCLPMWSIYNNVTDQCTCLDGSPMNDIGYCCPNDYESNDLGVCGCEHENEERLCASNLPDAEEGDCACVCKAPYTRNSYDHCCG
jgi:hypothetical protein